MPPHMKFLSLPRLSEVFCLAGFTVIGVSFAILTASLPLGAEDAGFPLSLIGCMVGVMILSIGALLEERAERKASFFYSLTERKEFKRKLATPTFRG